MELEVKHLAPYLPYGVKLVFENFPLHSKDCPHVRILELDCGHDFNLYLQRGHIKPILHPLSSISKPKEVNGKTVVVLDLIRDNNPEFSFNGEYLIEDCEYYFLQHTTHGNYPLWLIEILSEHHIDFQGLIPAGLAIDINTLNNK
jgi:hypothetical protein